MKKDSFFGKLVYGYDKLEEYVLCASLVLTTLIIFVQVIMRSVFNSSLTWSEELTRYIFIWQIWMGVSIAQKDKAHIKVEILKSFVKNQKVIAVVDVIATILLIAFNIFLVTSGVELVQQMISRGNVSSAMRMPMWIVYIVLPLPTTSLFHCWAVGMDSPTPSELLDECNVLASHERLSLIHIS